MRYLSQATDRSLAKRNLMKKSAHLLVLFASLAACGSSATLEGGFLREVPDELVALAAPNQNLQAVKLLEEDGCYWYQHDGPVETTLLPLLSKRGRRICGAKQALAQ